MLEYTNQFNLSIAINSQNCPQDNSIDNLDFGYQLYPEQKQVLYLMKKIEKQKYIYNNTNKDEKIYFNKFRLGAPFSFGKTVVSLALVKSDNIPIERDMYSFFNPNIKNSSSDLLELKIHRKKYVNTTLIVISSSTFFQWKEHIEKNNINCLYVDTLDDFDNLCVKLLNQELYLFDMVLLVYRKIKQGHPLPYGIKHINWSESSNLTILSILSIDKIWKRIMIDDFDTIGIYFDTSIPARIVWLISATNNCLNDKQLLHMNNCFKIPSINHRILDSLNDPRINILTIRTNLNVNIPKIKVICYIFEYGGRVNQILNSLHYSPEVHEKLNSGDISGAASLLGMSKDCGSMGEFLYLLINTNKSSYIDNIKKSEKIENLLKLIKENDHIIIREREREIAENIDNIFTCPSIIPYNDRSWNKYLIDLENNNQFITIQEIKKLEELLNNYKENICNLKNILERIKRNMEDGLCCKCYCEVEDEKFILQCCNILLCKYCILKNNSSIFIDRCPNCIKKLDKNSLLKLPNNSSLEDFINIDYDHAYDNLREYNKLQKNDDMYLDLFPKDAALLNILNNKTPDNCTVEEHIGVRMHGIIEDNIYIKNNDIKNYKYVIFTKWQYCANTISELLKKYSINNIILKGYNTKNINNIINKFRTNLMINVLIIASNNICSGLNLEFASHMIFYHSIKSFSITSQIIGRCQRIGRKTSLEIISLEHKNEISVFDV